MNPSHSVQDVLRCHLCETPVPPLSCEVCGIYLCKECVADHILDESSEHKVVPIKQTLSAFIFPKCSTHSPKNCKLFCKQCTIPICVQCASSKEHQGHIFVDLKKSVDNKKEEIKKDMQELELSILAEYKEIASNMPSLKAHICETSESLKNSIDKHGEKLHRKVEEIVDKLISEVDKKKEIQSSLLIKEENRITEKISIIEEFIYNQKQLQTSRELGSVFEYKSRNKEFRNVHRKHKVSLPTFSAKEIQSEQLLLQFGSLTTESDKIKSNVLDIKQAVTDPNKVSKQAVQNPKVREVSVRRDDIIFETFYHKSGKEFQCMYLDGMRFYLDDWGSKEWQPLPKSWYDEGLLITNSVVKQTELAQQQQQQSSGAGAPGSRPQQSGYQQQSSSGQDDREGVLNHPNRGRIPTYLFQRKHNIHCFYDRDRGQWMRFPIGWELHHEMVGKLVDQVEEALPTWGDRQDILALLRQCNYDPDECISTYQYLEGDTWLKVSKTHSVAKSTK